MKTLSSLICCFILASGFAAAQNIVNGNFESGRGVGWAEASTGGYTLIGTGNFFASTEIQPPVYTRSGNWMGRIGGFNYDINAIGQTITLPNTTPLYLGFYVQTRSANTSECAGLYVGAKVSVIVNNQIISSTYLCRYNDLMEWTPLFVDMSAIAGQTAQIIFKAESANSVWSFMYFDDVSLTSSITGVDDPSALLEFSLEQNYPNPFNPSTIINYQLDERAHVDLRVYNIVGEEVALILSEEKDPGRYSVNFNASGLSGGVYFYRLTGGNKTLVKSMILLK